MGLFNRKNNDADLLRKEVQALRWDIIEQTKAVKALKEQIGKQKEAILLLSKSDESMATMTKEALQDVAVALKGLQRFFAEVNDKLDNDAAEATDTPDTPNAPRTEKKCELRRAKPLSAAGCVKTEFKDFDGMTLTIDRKKGRFFVSKKLSVIFQLAHLVGNDKFSLTFKEHGCISIEFSKKGEYQLPNYDPKSNRGLTLYNMVFCRRFSEDRHHYEAYELDANTITLKEVE